MSPEPYSPSSRPPTPRPPTPTMEYKPSRLAKYDFYPHGGWGPPSDWATGPPIPLSEITPNTEPWPYPPERYLSPVPSGSLPFSASPSMAPSRNPSPSPQGEGTVPSPLSKYSGTDPSPPSQYSEASQSPVSPAQGHLAGPSSKTLFYHRPPTIVRNPRRTLLERISSPTPNTTVSLQPTHQHSPKFMGSQAPPAVSRTASESLVGTRTYDNGWGDYLRERVRERRQQKCPTPYDAANRNKTPSSMPSIPGTPGFLQFDPSRMGLPSVPRQPPTTRAPAFYHTMRQLVPQLTVKQFLDRICTKRSAGPAIGQNPLFRVAPTNAKDYPLCHWCGHDTHWSHLCPDPHLVCGFQERCQVPHSHRNWTTSTCTPKDRTMSW